MGDIDFYRKRVRNVTIDSKRSLMLLLNTHTRKIEYVENFSSFFNRTECE